MLSERVHPDFVILSEHMRFINLFNGHFLDHFFEAYRGIGIATDGGKCVPHVCAHEVGRRQAAPDLVVPADAGLGTGMSLHRRAEIPFEGADIVPRPSKTHGVHHADQFLGLGVARARSRPERVIGLFKAAFFHQVARAFQFRKCGAGKKQKGKNCRAHGLVFSCLASVAAAGDLPQPLTAEDFIEFDRVQAALGHHLFYDPILSGNRNIACAHCHHPDFGTGDGLSLGIGEGGRGLGPERTAGIGADRVPKRIPRNASGLWNLGARDLHTLFHDGRLSTSDIYGNGFNSPAQEWLPEGLNSLLAAQALFPLVAQFEMAGNPGENEVIGAVHDRIDAAWPILAKRVRTDEKYGALFVSAFDHISSPEEVTIVEIANALAAFMATEWLSIDSPFDKYLAGDTGALSAPQKRGMYLFYGEAECASCHSGPLMSDQKFHALGLPAFGPGRTRQHDPYARDVGRMAESNRLEDAYAFRTPMLRNVALTGPYGHNGAYPTLEGMIRHHLDPLAARATWETGIARLPSVPWLAETDFILHQDTIEMERQIAAIGITPLHLSDTDIRDLVAFLEALTGETVHNPPFGVPAWFEP